MEHLTKHQIVLLCFLVSFVSSIATGIVTVSLLDQAPPAVSQTINRVVERTIERVGTQATSTKETIIVREDQAIVSAISESSKSIVRIQSPVDGYIGLGVIVSGSGRIIAHTTAEFAGQATAALDGGNVVSVTLVSRDSATGMTVYQAEQSLDPRNARVYVPAKFADTSKLKLGESVVIVGGMDAPAAATGIVSSISGNRIKTDIREDIFDSQAVLVNLLGEVVGLRDQTNDTAFLASNSIKTYATP